MRGDRQEEFVRDSVNIDISYIGVNAGVSAGDFLGRILTGSARAFLSILEVTYQMLINPNRNIQILLLLHKIIRRNPRKRPPPIIIIRPINPLPPNLIRPICLCRGRCCRRSHPRRRNRHRRRRGSIRPQPPKRQRIRLRPNIICIIKHLSCCFLHGVRGIVDEC